MEKVGTFKVESGKIVVSDPCYERGVWCAAELDAVNGEWAMVADLSDEGWWGTRVAKLTARLNGPQGVAGKVAKTLDLGVDSGQMSVVDAAKYVGDTDSDSRSWYLALCDITNDYAGVFDGGCVSSSGYGDGSYPCTVWTDEDGRAVQVHIDFMVEDELDDEEEIYFEDYEEEYA